MEIGIFVLGMIKGIIMPKINVLKPDPVDLSYNTLNRPRCRFRTNRDKFGKLKPRF